MRLRRSIVLGASLAGALVTRGIEAQLPAAPDACNQGYVWREAFPGDHVCVSPKTRDRAAYDNSQASARREPGGGQYGPNTCKEGYVWRSARPQDYVCVTPQTRDQTAADNDQAASRRAGAGPARSNHSKCARYAGIMTHRP